MGLADLEAALDTYGADRTRWPAPLRHALSGLIAGNPEAAKMLKDAQLFDRLLDQAPQYDSARLGALAKSIAAAAESQPRVVPFSRPAPVPARPPVRRWDYGYAGAALAASLLVGIIAGQTNLLRPAAELVIGDGSSYDASGTQLAQTDDADTLLDEDLL